MKQKQPIKALVVATLLTSSIMLSACSGNNADNSSNNTTPPASSSNTGNEQSNTGNASNAPSNGTSNSGNTTGNTTNTGNSSNSGNTANNSSGNTTSPSNNDNQSTVDIKAMLTLAKNGQVNGIPFKADTGLIDDVEKDWGKSDKTDFAGKGMYATYAKKHAVIGFNKGSQIFDVRSDAPELQTLTLKQIEAALGKADKVTKNGSDTIYTYEAGKTFELRFIISKDTGKVHHISVYAPKDTINNMAG